MESYEMEVLVEESSDDDRSSGSGDENKEDFSKELNPVGNSETRDCNDAPNNIEEISTADFVNREFECVDEAYKLYVKYARCAGFGVRRGHVARDDHGNLIRQRFLCNRARLRDKKHFERFDRKRGHKLETRTNCMAKLCVYLDKSRSTWKVSRLYEEHNRELIPLQFVHLIPNHQRMTDSDKAQVNSMHRHEIATFQILGFLAGQAGGYEGVGFLKKDLYNYIDRNRRGHDLWPTITWLHNDMHFSTH